MKPTLSILMFLILTLTINATTQNIPMMPLEPENPVEDPRKNRIPMRNPIITITDKKLLKVECIPIDAEVEIRILDKEATLFIEYSQSHEIYLPQLPSDVTYTLTLIVNNQIWIGNFSINS